MPTQRSTSDMQVTVEIRDDGAGFDPDAPLADTAVGHFGSRLADLSRSPPAPTPDLATAPGPGHSPAPTSTTLRVLVPAVRVHTAEP